MLSSRDVRHSLLRRPVIISSASLSFQQDPRLQQSVNLSPGHKSHTFIQWKHRAQQLLASTA